MVVSTAGLNDDDCIEPTPEIVAVHGSSNTTCSRCGESKHVEPESQSHKMSPGMRAEWRGVVTDMRWTRR